MTGLIIHREARAAERIFIWGGGGKDKKGHNVKKGTNGAHADNITNVLMKHYCIDIRFLFTCLA